MKIGRLNRASFAKTARRAMFLFAFAALGTQAATVAMVDGTGYETLEAAIVAAEPVDGVVTYEICGKAEVSATGWIQVLKSGLSNVKKVAFVGKTEDAEICIAGDLAILADQQYDIDVSFKNLKLSKPNPEYGGDYGHSTNYFTTWLRNTGAAENTVTYENCTFPNGACNNQYGKTVYTNCTFANGTTGLYNLWIYGGSVEMDGGVFTGTRGMKVYTEGTPATAPSVEVKGTAFSGLTEKAAIVVSKAATVKFAEVSVADCPKGLFQKDIEGSSDDQKVTVTANGSKISGSFAITANKEPETAKTEFNITGGMFTAEVPSDYCADGFTVKATTDADGNTVYGVVEEVVAAKVGETAYETLDEAIKAVRDGETIVVNAGEYKLNDSLTYTGKAFTIQAAAGAKVSFDMSAAVALHGAKITFSGVTFDYKTNKDYIGLQHADTLVYNDCTVKGQVFLYAASETFNRCTFTQTAVDRYNVWTYGAKAVTFNGCTFNCVGKSVLVYNEGSISKTELAVSDCEFKASAPVEGKAAIEIDTSLMAGGATITVDAKTTAEGFAEGSNSKNTLWNDKKQKQDTNKNTTVTVAGETVFTPIVAQVGEKTYTTLAAALADVAEGKPLTWVAEGAWPVKTPVYYNGTFYETETGFAAKGALERAIDAANAEGAAAVAKIYVRPGFAADELVLQAHQQLKTGLAIYGNDAKLSCNWEPCVEYPGTSGDSGAHQLTKDVSLAIYNLHNGAGFWGRRTTAYTVDLKLSGCRNAHQVMFYGNADTGVKGKTNISVTNCTFDATNKETGHNVLVTIGAGTVDVSDTTFTAANINVKNVDGGDNVITVKDCTFKDTVAGNQNIRVRSYAEGTHADLTIENVTFAGDSTQNVEIGDSKAECKGVVNYTITKTSGTMNVYKQGVTTAEATTLDAAVAYSGDNVGTIADEKALRRAFFAAPTDGTAVTVTLGADITLETLYAAENFGTEKLDDNAEGDTFNRYKVGVHPTAEDPNHWNPLVTKQTQEQRLAYGAYYHMSAGDERIARLVVKSGQKIVLDLNGHTIQKNARATHGDWSTVCTDIIGNYGTLEIVDSSTGAKGTIKGIGYISCQGAVLHNYAGATMTVTGVNVDGNAAGMAEGTGQYVVSNEGGTLTLDGVNVHDTATSASLIMSNGGMVTIKNATLSHPATKVINAKGGEINIESVSVTSEEYAVFVTGDARVNVNGSLTIEGTGTLCVEGDAAALTKKPGVELSAPAGFTWVENDGVQVLKSFVAKVGETAYVTIAEAIAVLSAENHTLTLLNENAWDATTPVYWAAGTQSGYAATLTEALTAAYKANAGAITIVCRPGADVGTMTHGHVADDLTIYGNDAYLSGGECDLEVDTYTFSRATGKQAADGVCLDKDITITAYELDNLGVWGERHTANKVTVNLTDCDGKALEGKTNVQRVYISGTTGVNDITLTDCDFLTKATAVYSNADGAIKAVNCSFTGGEVPFNINHKANGTQTVAVENCTFTNCGDAGGWKQFAAPLRLVNSGAGTQSAEVTGCAFAGTVGTNGDILLGDGRTGQASNDVELKVVNTAANIQAQKPGYYGGESVDATKKATAESPAEGTLETSVAKLLPVNDGSEAHPYSREQFAAMTRAEYIAAQGRLGGTLYVNVGDYAYGTDGVLGNGVRNDTPGQVPDHSKLNAYGENGCLGEKNDGANGQTVVFVGGTITSGVTGYTSIDNIGTSLLLAVPAYTKVTFEKTTFKNVLSFNYQLYTSPWSQLGGLTFNGCTFDGIIVGAIAAQELAFNGCTFNNYVNTTSANSSNPTWIRPAYGNWTKGDNEGQGTDFRSLTKITFENNTVTSTRPVKFERIAQWEMATTVTATNNTFAITPQEGDKDEKKTKNVGLYFGANAKFNLVIDENKKSDETAALYTAVYLAPTGGTYAGLPAGSTVKNTAGEKVTTEDALAWKTTKKITLKTTTEVASVTNAKGVSVNFATLADAIAAAQAGETVTLLADVESVSVTTVVAGKDIVLDLNGKTLTSTANNGITIEATAKLTVKDSLTGGKVVATGKYSNAIENKGTLVIESGSFEAVYGAIRALGGSTTTISGGTFASSTGRYGMYYWANGTALSVTVNGGLFKNPVSTAMENGKVVLSIKGGSFASDLTDYCGADAGTYLDKETGLYVYGRESEHVPEGYVVDENGNVTISDEESLFWFAQQVNVRGNTFTGKTVSLADDIALTAKWTPVGVSVEKSFKGTFDGKDHAITGMKVSGASQAYGYGFFKLVISATVKNVTFTQAEVRSEYSNVVGCVAGYSYGSSTFENVHVTDSLVYAFGKVGGFVGMAEDAGATTTFRNCSVEATTIHGGYNVAGFCGLVMGTCAFSGSSLTDVTPVVDEDSQGFGKVVVLDTTVVCDGSVATCAGTGTSIKGRYIPNSGCYWSAYSDLYNHYGDSKHDCTLADGKMLANSEVVHDAPVAIGDARYSDLQAAFDAAKTGDTVTLLSDITLTEQVNITKALDGLTLDGNGKTIICATTDDPLKSGGSALYFGNANDHLYCTGIKIKDLTMTGTARFAIFLCGGTTTEFTNVKVSGNYYIAVNLYGTHGATMTNCDISNSTKGTDKYISAIWSNVASANPLTLNNSKVDVIAINTYTTANKLEPKIFVMDGSEVGEIHTFDDGTVSGNKKLCVSASSTGKYVVKEYDETIQTWVDIRVTVVAITLGGEKKKMPFADAWLADNIGADASSWTTEALEEKAANGLAKWQCYLFGLDPRKEDAKVVATAGQGTDEAIPLTVANADASASPLVKDGYVTVAYVLMGSNDGTAWTPVATSDKRDGLKIPLTGTTYKFYRVDVTVTSAEGN